MCVHLHVSNVFMYAGATACKWRAEDSSYLPPVLEIAPLLMFIIVFKLAGPQASGDSPIPREGHAGITDTCAAVFWRS